LLALVSQPLFTFNTGYNYGYAMGFGGPYLLPTYLPNLTFGRFSCQPYLLSTYLPNLTFGRFSC
jgi:hypothetical protein